MRVLLVDDSAVIRSRLVPLLRDIHGVTEVREAAGCSAAQTEVDRHEPDLIILDIQMPDGNGIDLLRTLRRRGLVSPVIVLTNYPLVQYHEASLKDRVLEIVSTLAASDREGKEVLP
jgi:DNA-binding NarL/FixJ family response regulator